MENIFQENADTVEGSRAHRGVDAPSRIEDLNDIGLPEGSKIRSLKLESETLGLIGVVDILEGGPDGAVLIDYKKGSARRDREGERIVKEPDAMQIAAQAAQKFLEYGVDVSFFAPSGRFLGLLRGLPASGVDARRGQYRLFEEPGIHLKISREMIRAKIHNQRVMLMRNGNPPKQILDRMMEEFRPLIADSVAVSLINRGELNKSDFLSGASGVFLNEHGRRAFWEAYSRRLDTEISHPQFEYKMAYRRMFEVQARQMWRFVRGECEGYAGFTTR